MNSTAQHIEARLSPPDLAMDIPERSLDPEGIREAVSLLMARGELDLAGEMSDLARMIHPNNESIWAISALVAEVMQDWLKAHALLTRLRQLQGNNVTAETYRHHIRVLRCLGSDFIALSLVRTALNRYPSDASLQDELEALLTLLKTSSDSLV